MSESSVLDINPQLEVILKSIDLEDSVLLEPILNSPEVDNLDKEAIRKYLKLMEISGRPSTLLLEKEIPGRNFELEPIEKELLPEYIEIFLFNKKNLNTSKSLMELSAKVRAEGLDEKVIKKLTDLTKVDHVKREFVNIRDTFVEKYENSEYNVGIPIGIKFIDDMVGGIHKGEIAVISGFAGHCKTTAAVNAAYSALTQNQNVLYLSLEVTKDNIYCDFISRHSNSKRFKMRIPHYKLKKKQLKDNEWEYAKDVIMPDFNNKIPGKVYVIDETDLDNYKPYSLLTKFREVDKIAQKETGHGIDVVIIDHIQLLKFGEGPASSNGEVINSYVSFLRQQCMDWLSGGRQIAMVILSQTNRTGYLEAKANNGKYGATAMAEANELERAATLILTVYTEAEMKDMGIAKMQVLKYRDSRSDDDPVEVAIDLEHYLFSDSIEGASTVSAETSENLLDQLSKNEDNLDEMINLDDFSWLNQ